MKISIVTVCYQARETIEATVESVLGQTYHNLEYWIIDGGSTDGTREILERLGENGRFQYLSEKDKGIYDAMNKGVSMCSGDYILFLNAGDIFANCETVEEVASGIDRNDDIVYGDFYEKKDGEISLVHYGSLKITPFFWLMSKTICHQTIFAARRWLSDYPFDISYLYAADRKWLAQCVLGGAKMRYLEMPIVFYDRTGISSETKNQEEVRAEVDRFLLEMFPVRARLLGLVKKNKRLRSFIRKKMLGGNK